MAVAGLSSFLAKARIEHRMAEAAAFCEDSGAIDALEVLEDVDVRQEFAAALQLKPLELRRFESAAAEACANPEILACGGDSEPVPAASAQCHPTLVPQGPQQPAAQIVAPTTRGYGHREEVGQSKPDFTPEASRLQPGAQITAAVPRTAGRGRGTWNPRGKSGRGQCGRTKGGPETQTCDPTVNPFFEDPELSPRNDSDPSLNPFFHDEAARVPAPQAHYFVEVEGTEQSRRGAGSGTGCSGGRCAETRSSSGNPFFDAEEDLTGRRGAPSRASAARHPNAAGGGHYFGSAELDDEHNNKVDYDALRREALQEARRDGPRERGVGAYIRSIDGELWGCVVADAGRNWRLASGRSAKKENEGKAWVFTTEVGAARHQRAGDAFSGHAPSVKYKDTASTADLERQGSVLDDLHERRRQKDEALAAKREAARQKRLEHEQRPAQCLNGEVRLDPDDDREYTFAQIAAKYRSAFSEQEIRGYWDADCQPIQELTRPQRPAVGPPAQRPAVGPPAQRGAARRLDPDDGRTYTFHQIRQKYHSAFSMSEIQAYWDQECQPA